MRKRYLTKRQFAEALGLSIRTVERKVERNLIQLAGRTFGGHWRFTLEELDRCRKDPQVMRNWTRPAFIIKYEAKQIAEKQSMRRALSILRGR